jgi:predicted nucleotide-binding protein (sugar kinase/HSP70/actin superfamily)
MAENYILQDALLSELSDVNLFCKLIRYPSIRDNMVKVFKVIEMKNQLMQFIFLPHLMSTTFYAHAPSKCVCCPTTTLLYYVNELIKASIFRSLCFVYFFLLLFIARCEL